MISAGHGDGGLAVGFYIHGDTVTPQLTRLAPGKLLHKLQQGFLNGMVMIGYFEANCTMLM